MGQLTKGYWQETGGKNPRRSKKVTESKPAAPKKTEVKESAPKKTAVKESAPKKVTAPSTRPSVTKAPKLARSRPQLSRTAVTAGIAVVAAVAVAGGSVAAYTQGAFDPVVSMFSSQEPETSPIPDPPKSAATILTEVTSAVELAYAPAIHTAGTATLDDGREISFDTSWLSDGSVGHGTLRLGGSEGEAYIYKNTLILNNDSGLVDSFISKPTQVEGWLIMVSPSLEQAFPSLAKVSALTATPEDDLVVDGDRVTGSGVTATLTAGEVTRFVTDISDYTIEPLDPAEVSALPDGFKADGKVELVEGEWETSQFMHD